MNSYLLAGVSISTIGIAAYYYGKQKLQEYIMAKVMKELNDRMEKQTEEDLFKPFDGNSAMIKITTAGKTHSLYVPYNRKKSTIMLRRRVFLIKKGEKIDISQKPGVPYMICAADLGGESIIVEDLEGEAVHTFTEKEIPNCF